MIDIKNIYWAAGFLEGEGCFYFRGNSACITAGQVQREPLEKLNSLFGGTIIFYSSKQINHKDSYQWGIYGQRAIGLALTVYTLMSMKRKFQIQKQLERWKKAPGCNRYKFATHCIRGHIFDDENTYRPPAGGRKCRTCVREAARRNYLKKLTI